MNQKKVKAIILKKLAQNGNRLSLISRNRINYQGIDNNGNSLCISVHSASPNKVNGSYMFDITQEQYDYLASADRSGLFLILDDGSFLNIMWSDLKAHLDVTSPSNSAGQRKWMLDFHHDQLHLNRETIITRFVHVYPFGNGPEQPLAA